MWLYIRIIVKYELLLISSSLVVASLWGFHRLRWVTRKRTKKNLNMNGRITSAFFFSHTVPLLHTHTHTHGWGIKFSMSPTVYYLKRSFRFPHLNFIRTAKWRQPDIRFCYLVAEWLLTCIVVAWLYIPDCVVVLVLLSFFSFLVAICLLCVQSFVSWMTDAVFRMFCPSAVSRAGSAGTKHIHTRVSLLYHAEPQKQINDYIMQRTMYI